MLTHSLREGAAVRPVFPPQSASLPAIKLGLARPGVNAPVGVGGAR